MKLAAIISLTLLTPSSHGFLLSPSARQGISARTAGLLRSKFSEEEEERIEKMGEIMAQQTNAASMAESARAMKDMKPEDMNRIIQEMDAMGPAQVAQLKSLGMDPALMKKSLQMMRENPTMMASAQRMMESMTPEQMLEQSRLAQQQMKNMTPEDVEVAAKAIGSLSPDQVDAAAETMKQSRGADEGEEEETAKEESPVAIPLEGSAADPKVIDAMFRVGELMSQPPNGGVTFRAFSTLPPVVMLSGDREMDLSAKELAECWEDGALGATRVDRAGFERVWDEVRDYFEGDIMEEARKMAKKATAKTSAEVISGPSASSTSSASAATPKVGETLSPQQIAAMNDQVKNLSEDDVDAMLKQMESMSPEQRERMKAMGVDPAMMQRASEMMQNNPMMKKAAQEMMKRMTPDQMMKASERAQEQLSNMSKEDYEKAMERMKSGQ